MTYEEAMSAIYVTYAGIPQRNRRKASFTISLEIWETLRLGMIRDERAELARLVDLTTLPGWIPDSTLGDINRERIAHLETVQPNEPGHMIFGRPLSVRDDVPADFIEATW